MNIPIEHNRSANQTLRIVNPNGHLGFAPIKTGSFRIGLTCQPDMVAADLGSCDCGPGPLGSDTCASPFKWQKHDLEEMLTGARNLRVPMIIGSAGDTGTRQPRGYVCPDHQGSREAARHAAVQAGVFLFGRVEGFVARGRLPPARRLRGWTDGPALTRRSWIRRSGWWRWPACIRSSSCWTRAPT